VLIVGVALAATQTKGYGSDIKYVLDSNGLLTKQASPFCISPLLIMTVCLS